MSSLPREDAVGGGDGGGTGGHVVALKSNKKRMMDREHYLDATQRYVQCLSIIPIPSFVHSCLLETLKCIAGS